MRRAVAVVSDCAQGVVVNMEVQMYRPGWLYTAGLMRNSGLSNRFPGSLQVVDSIDQL